MSTTDKENDDGGPGETVEDNVEEEKGEASSSAPTTEAISMAATSAAAADKGSESEAVRTETSSAAVETEAVETATAPEGESKRPAGSGNLKAAEGKASMSSIESSVTSPKKRKGKQSWTDKEDEALMIAVLEQRKISADKDDLSEEEDSDESDDDEDYDEIEWDVISTSVSGRTAVECLKRYLKLKKNDDVAKAVSVADIVAMSEKNPAALIANQKQQKRKGESVVSETPEMTLSPSKKKKKDATSWTEAETSLLSSLAEQYQDSKFVFRFSPFYSSEWCMKFSTV